MLKHALVYCFVASVSACLLGQQPATKSAKAADTETTPSENVDLGAIPEKRVNLSLATTRQKIAISPVTSFALCDSEGYLLLDLLNPKDFNQHTLISIAGDKSQTYLPSAISDLRDVLVRGFYSSGSTVAFLVRGTRQNQKSQATSKSPAGFDWNSYHQYLARFKRDGTYEGALELDVSDDISRVALLSSGEILALGYDSLNSALRLLVLDSSGKKMRTLDLPAGRRLVDGGAPYGSAEAMMTSGSVAGAVAFTPYRENILVWRRNSDDPLLEVRPGGATREIVLQVPKDFKFVELIPATDWWVANFRRKDVKEGTPYGPADYAYFELRPQDASLSAKLSISPGGPQYLACEADGNYMTFTADKDSNIQIYNSK